MSQSDFVTRGQALVSSGQFQEAVKVCRLGLLGRPTTVEGRVVLGQALLALKRYDEVLAEMRVALELDHASVAAQVLKGEALLRKGDPHAAVDVLQRLRTQAPGDPRVEALFGEAERAAGRPKLSASHPSVGFLEPSATAESTKHYVNHGADSDDDTSDDEDAAGSYTRPTSLQGPGGKKRSGSGAEGTPSRSVHAVGVRTGTVEVDPDLDGVEVQGNDDDFGDIAAPPMTRPRPNASAPPPDEVFTMRGPGSMAAQVAAKRPKPKAKKLDISTVELDDDEVFEVQETLDSEAYRPGPGTNVRNAVKLPSGPLASPAASRPTQHGAAAPPPQFAPAMPGPPPGAMPGARPILAPQATLAAQPPPPQPVMPPPLQASPMQAPPGAMRSNPPPLTAEQQRSGAAAADALFMPEAPPGPPWAQGGMAPPGMQGMPPQHMPPQGMPPQGMPPHGMPPQGMPPQGMPPHAMQQGMPPYEVPSNAFPVGEPSGSGSKALKTGVRKARSRFQLTMWILVGALVIGGGVFAGFQIRAMRLRNQIESAREEAATLSRSDTWKGWVNARDRLARIAQASATPDNYAALARTRALVAFEFGDGLDDAKAALAAEGAQSGLDGKLAAAYLALAQGDTKAASAAVDEVNKLAKTDAAALYVTGRAALLAGDAKGALASLQASVKADARPLAKIGVARAHAALGQWKEAIDELDSALKLSPDHPEVVIARASMLVVSNRLAPTAAAVGELRTALQKVIAEGGKPLDDQPHGVSRADLAFANLALARLDHQRNDDASALKDIKAAVDVKYDSQVFAEEAVETLYAIGQVQAAAAASERALKYWANDRRIRIARAQALIAIGRAAEVPALLDSPELGKSALGMAVLGQARAATGDIEHARANFDAALKLAPDLEVALVGHAWLDLAVNDVAGARTRVEARYKPETASPALATVYASILRRSTKPEDRAQAKAILEKLPAGAPALELARAQLELARLYRDAGDLRAARPVYAEAQRLGSYDAQLESGQLLLEDNDLTGARDTFDNLLKQAGDHPPSLLLIEAARAHMLDGDHAGAEALLARPALEADKTAAWLRDRERARLALRKLDLKYAATKLLAALPASGDDVDTLLLAADVAAADAAQTELATMVREVAPVRLKGRPELDLVWAKLQIFANPTAAKTSYEAAAKGLATASKRRQAQAEFGLALLADPKDASAALKKITRDLDKSLDAAWLYYAEMVKDSNTADAFAAAQQAVKFNPDSLDGWIMLAAQAAKLNDRDQVKNAVTRANALNPTAEQVQQLKALMK